MPNTSRQKGRPSQLSKAKLDALVAEAIADAYDESEQRTGLLTMIQDNLQLPFETTVLGVSIRVQSSGLQEGLVPPLPPSKCACTNHQPIWQDG